MPAAPYREPLAALDVVCIHAAGCDLAIAFMGDTGSRGAVNHSFHGAVASLLQIHQRATREFNKNPEADGLLALMDVQVMRTLAACVPVRSPLPCSATWHASSPSPCPKFYKKKKCAAGCAAAGSAGDTCCGLCSGCSL